jgi:hypothetical protein
VTAAKARHLCNSNELKHLAMKAEDLTEANVLDEPIRTAETPYGPGCFAPAAPRQRIRREKNST